MTAPVQASDDARALRPVKLALVVGSGVLFLVGLVQNLPLCLAAGLVGFGSALTLDVVEQLRHVPRNDDRRGSSGSAAGSGYAGGDGGGCGGESGSCGGDGGGGGD